MPTYNITSCLIVIFSSNLNATFEETVQVDLFFVLDFYIIFLHPSDPLKMWSNQCESSLSTLILNGRTTFTWSGLRLSLGVENRFHSNEHFAWTTSCFPDSPWRWLCSLCWWALGRLASAYREASEYQTCKPFQNMFSVKICWNIMKDVSLILAISNPICYSLCCKRNGKYCYIYWIKRSFIS